MMLLSANSSNVLVQTLSNLLFWGAIISTCFVIVLGFIFQKKKFLIQDWEKPLVKIVLLVGLPAMILKNFMVDLDFDTFVNMLVLLLIGIFTYIFLSLISRLFFLKNDKSIQDTLSMCVAISSVLYFGYPIAQSLFLNQKNALIELKQASNLFNIGFWIFLSAYSLYIISRPIEGINLDGKKLKTKGINIEQNDLLIKNRKLWKIMILNPIIISLIIGLALWIMQLIPKIKIIHVTDSGWNTIDPGYYSITRLDALIPGFNQILTTLAVLPTPLSWLAIGAIIAKSDLKIAIKNKLVWYSSFLKIVFVPLFTLLILVLFALIGKQSHLFTISNVALVVIVLMSASPTATAIASYALIYDKHPNLAAETTTLSTILCAFTMPIWTIITVLISSTNIFTQIN